MDDIIYDDVLDGEEDHECPCGCQDDPNKCVYASTCITCKRKYFGNGYGETKMQCPDCKKVKQ